MTRLSNPKTRGSMEEVVGKRKTGKLARRIRT